MTAHGAVISLKNTIDYILHCSHFSLVEPSLDIMQPAYKELQPLQEILERLDSTSISKSRKKVNDVDGRIKERLWEFEDLLESHILSQQILSQSPPHQVDGRTKLERAWRFQGLSESLPSEFDFKANWIPQVTSIEEEEELENPIGLNQNREM